MRPSILTFHLDEVEIVDGPHDWRVVQRQVDDGRDARRRIGDLLVPGHVRVGDAIDQHRSDLPIAGRVGGFLCASSAGELIIMT